MTETVVAIPVRHIHEGAIGGHGDAKGKAPTGIVAVTVLEAVSMTETVSLTLVRHIGEGLRLP